MAKAIGPVARHFKVSYHTARRWVRTWEETGGVDEKPGRGRPPALSPAGAKRARAMLKDPDMGGPVGVARELEARGTTDRVLHKTTILRSARRASPQILYADRRRPAQRLSAATKAKRLAFALANQDRDWTRVMFTDRKKFLLLYPGTKIRGVVYREKGEPRATATRANPPKAFNIYAGLTMQGCTKVHAVAGSSTHSGGFETQAGTKARGITKAEYRVVVRETFLPEGTRLLAPTRRSRWVLQQDGDPTHSVAAEELSKRQVKAVRAATVLEGWPAQSPDLNPIENLWAAVDRVVKAKGCKSIQEFERAIEGELAALTPEACARYIQDMPRRIKEVIARGGDRIGC